MGPKPYWGCEQCGSYTYEAVSTTCCSGCNRKPSRANSAWMAGHAPKPAVRGGNGYKPKSWAWNPQGFTTQPRGGSRGLRKAKGAAARDAYYDEWETPAITADKTIENARAKATAAVRAFAKVASDADEIRDSNAHAESLDLAQAAGRQAASAAKPWALRKKHGQSKIDHKERTTESAKNRLKSSEEELVAFTQTLTLRIAKERAEYNDRKSELNKSRDEMVVILSTRSEFDSSDEEENDDDDDDDDSEDECSMRGQLARNAQALMEATRLIASLRDDVSELKSAAAKSRTTGNSVVSVSIASGDEEGEETSGSMQVDKKVRLALGPSGKKQAKNRRSRSRVRRSGDYDPDAIWDGSGTTKIRIE
jgi:hypothetical protein